MIATKVRVGRLVLNESQARNLSEKPSTALSRTLQIEGSQYGGGDQVRAVHRSHQDLIGMYGALVPVTFDLKPEWNGYYYVNSPQSELTDWPSEGAALNEWEIDLELAGYTNDIDLESRLGGPLTLANEHTAVGERWHAPPPGHKSYWSGTAQPSQLVRNGIDGPIVIYRDLAVGVNPRWSCDPLNYGGYRVKFIDSYGFERCGLQSVLEPDGWELSNGLVRVTVPPSGGTLTLSSYFGGWESKNWDIRVNDTDIAGPDSITVTRNDYEVVQVRLLWNVTPSGRLTADLTMRRGARFVEVYLKHMLSVELGIHPATGEASTNAAGYITATGNDGAGNRYVAGSPATYTADTTNGGLSDSATTFLDAVIGVVEGGAGTDTAALMYEQFLGSPTERVIGVRL